MGETSKEATSVLSKALNWKEKPDKDAEYNLTENVTIPSHADVENDSLTNLHEYEQGLKPLAPASADLSSYTDSEDCEQEKLTETEENLDLEQELSRSLTEEVGTLGQTAASSAAEVSEDPMSSVQAPDFEEDLRQSLTEGLAESLSSTLSGQVTSLLGAVTGVHTHQRRSSDLDDFEIIDEAELDT